MRVMEVQYNKDDKKWRTLLTTDTESGRRVELFDRLTQKEAVRDAKIIARIMGRDLEYGIIELICRKKNGQIGPRSTYPRRNDPRSSPG